MYRYIFFRSSQHQENMFCTKIVLNIETKTKKQLIYTSCSPDVLSLQFSIFMIKLSSYCELVDAKIRASDIDLPINVYQFQSMGCNIYLDCNFLGSQHTQIAKMVFCYQNWSDLLRDKNVIEIEKNL